MQDLGQKIKTIREIKNLKQEYMAEQLNMTQSAYSKLERVGDKIVYEKIERIADVFGMKPEQIISFDPATVLHMSGENHIAPQHLRKQVKTEFQKTESKKDALIKVLKEQILKLKRKLKKK